MIRSCFLEKINSTCVYCKQDTTFNLVIDTQGHPVAYACNKCRGPHGIPKFPDLSCVKIKTKNKQEKTCCKCDKPLFLDPCSYDNDYCRVCAMTEKI